MPYYPRYLPPAIDRFEAKIIRLPIIGCWLWEGAVDLNGYGRFRAHDGAMLAHRFSYEFHIGPIPAGMYACHSCDVPSCCNPAHLFIGTQRDNMRDAVIKGRISSGEHRPLAVLTSDIVQQIKSSSEKQSTLAARYGVHQVTISKIKRGMIWRHIR
jgi:hypothetical protein